MNNKTIKKCGTLARGKNEHSNNSIHRIESDPREIPLNGFNRFDPKYISIGPKSLRENYTAMNSSKCATLRHGGRYGGSLSDRGANPVLKKASPPSVAIVSKEFNASSMNIYEENNAVDNVRSDIKTIYNLSNTSIAGVSGTSRYNNSECLSYKQSSSKHIKDIETNSGNYNYDSYNFIPRTVYSIESQTKAPSLKSQSVLEQSHKILPLETSRLKEDAGPLKASIVSQPLPAIPPKNNQSHRNQQLLSASNLNKHRSIPLSNKYPNNIQNCSNQKSTIVSATYKKEDQPPVLPPKNRNLQNKSIYKNNHIQPGNKNRSFSRETGKSQKKIGHVTYSTFGYDCSGLEKNRTQNTDIQNNQNKKGFSQVSYQTLPNKTIAETRKECGNHYNDSYSQYSSSSSRRLEQSTMYSNRRADETHAARSNRSNRYVGSMVANLDINHRESTDFTGKVDFFKLCIISNLYSIFRIVGNMFLWGRRNSQTSCSQNYLNGSLKLGFN